MIHPTRPPDDAFVGHLADERPLGSFVAEAASADPSGLALVEGGIRLSNQGLFDRTERMTGGLLDAGVGPGDVVTLELPNWWETSVLMHALLRLGAVVNPVVPIYREREMRFIVGQARPRVVVIPHRFRGFDYVEMMRRVIADLDVDLPLVLVVRPEGPLPAGYVPVDETFGGSAPAAMAVRSPEEVALLLYTSGTTADPKGVLHDHRTLAYENRSIAELFSLSERSTVFMGSPVTHITGFLYGVLLPSMLGAPVALLDVWDPVAARRLVDDERCRFTVGATPFLHGLNEQYMEDPGPCPLEAFACGGADVPAALVRSSRHNLDAAVVRVYGSSEFPTVTCTGPEADERVAAETDGLPIGPVECRIDDPDGDGVGELLCRGPERFLGYMDPLLNEDAFTGDGWFRTGDVASIDSDGAVTIRGRRKDIIVRGGENISVGEVESLLYEHPGIAEIAIVAMPDDVMVEKACAFVVLADGCDGLVLDDLVAFLTERRLAKQKYPEALVVVAELPKTPSGKVQKFALRERIAASVSASHRS